MTIFPSKMKNISLFDWTPTNAANSFFIINENWLWKETGDLAQEKNLTLEDLTKAGKSFDEKEGRASYYGSSREFVGKKKS